MALMVRWIFRALRGERLLVLDFLVGTPAQVPLRFLPLTLSAAGVSMDGS